MVKTGYWWRNLILWTIESWLVLPTWYVTGIMVFCPWGDWQYPLDEALESIRLFQYPFLENYFAEKPKWRKLR